MRKRSVATTIAALTLTGTQAAVTTSFTHLYALQQQQRGLRVDERNLHTRASCDRGAASVARGPGHDWVCTIIWRTMQATTGSAAYSLDVHADGCFSADGDGPVDLNGAATLVDADGATVVNPLWAFDGCFPLQ